MAESAAMTVDFLRARLLSERSVSRADKERADQLAKRVAELDEQVRAVTAQRRQAERAATEVLAILESQGFGGHLSDVADSGSDHDINDDKDQRHAKTSEEEQAPPPQGETDDAMSGTAQPGGLSWKGRSMSPRKARQLMHKQRRNYFYFLASDPSPKYRMGQSCRKNKRKELISNGRSTAPEEEGGDVAERQKGQQDGSDCTDDGRADMNGEAGGDDRSSGDGGGQYVMRYEKDGEMKRVLDRQAELICQYEAEEEAQRQWEKQFNENRSCSKGDAEVNNKAHQIENGWEQSNQRASLAGQEAHCNQATKAGVKNLPRTSSNHSGRLSNGSLPESPQNASGQRALAAHESHEEHGHHPAQARRSSSGVSAVARQNQCQGDRYPSQHNEHFAMKAPSDGSPSTSDDTLDSKVSDWSSSHFHDHGDNHQLELGTRPSQQARSNADVGSVLEALRFAKMSLRLKLSRPAPLPPSQVTLALPAPGDEHAEDDYFPEDDVCDPAREELCVSSPSRQEMLALPAPEIHHGRVNFPANGAGVSAKEELATSSPQRQEILALPAPGDDFHSEIEDDMKKIPSGISGLFRLPTDSFPKEEMLSSCCGTAYGSGLSLRPTTRQNAFPSNTADHVTAAGDDSGFSAEKYYGHHGSVLLSVPSSGRYSITSSDFTIGGNSFLSGIHPGLDEDFRKGRPLGDADLFMQRGCEYTITNKWML